MSNWFDVVEEYVSNDALRNQLHRAIRTSLGDDFAPDLIHPVEEPSGMLLMSRGEELFLIRFFDPPPSATIIFLGSLRGGVYSETVTKHDDTQIVDGEFTHERLGGSNPLRIRFAVESYRTPGERIVVPLLSELTFDLTVTSVFLPLVAGGRLVVISDDEESPPAA